MIYGYPIVGKKKSLHICKAFAAGCGGTVVEDNTLRDGDAFFYGVDDSNAHIWRAVLSDHSRNFWYIDNAYFDKVRETYFRITRNMLQCAGVGTSDGKRFAALDIEVKPWRNGGKHVLICPQSNSFMRFPVGYRGDWVNDVSREIAFVSNRPICIRPWQRNKGEQARSLLADLVDAHCVVVWSSAAAITAALNGVPVIVQGQSAASAISGSVLELEKLPQPDRTSWLGVLADNQWTLTEMTKGIAWRSLNQRREK